MTQEEQEYLKQQLSLPDIISLFKIEFEGEVHTFCSDFRLEPVYWNSLLWEYMPLTIDSYRFSEDNASSTPTLNLSNVAAMYSEILSVLPDLAGGRVTYFQVFKNYIQTSALAEQFDIFYAKYSFVLAQQLSKTPKRVAYRLDPPGFMVNTSAPSRLILREGLFNMAFPGAGEKYQG